MSSASDADMGEIFDFLSEVDLDSTLPVLIEFGFTSMESLETIGESHLDEMCRVIADSDVEHRFRQHIEDLQTIGVAEWRENGTVSTAYDDPAEFHQIQEVRRNTLSGGAPQLPPIQQKEEAKSLPPLPMTLTAASSPADVIRWMEAGGFPDYVISAMEDCSARDVLNMGLQEAVDLLGDEQGHLLFERIQQQNASPPRRMTTSSPSVSPSPPSSSLPSARPVAVAVSPASMRSSAPLTAGVATASAAFSKTSTSSAPSSTAPSVSLPPGKGLAALAKVSIGTPPSNNLNQLSSSPRASHAQLGRDPSPDNDDWDAEFADVRRHTKSVFSDSRKPTVSTSTSTSRSAKGNETAQTEPSPSADLALITKGGIFSLYEPDKPNPTRVFLFYSRDPLPDDKDDGDPNSVYLGAVCWNPSCRREILDGKYVRVDELSDIYVGKEENVFESPAASRAIGELCFSLVSDDIILNLEVIIPDRAAEVTSWLRGLQTILSENGSSIICAQNEESEKAESKSAKTNNKSPPISPKSSAIAMTASAALSLTIPTNSANPKRMTVLNARNATINGLGKSGTKSLREGFLWKLGGLRKNWSKRYFKLIDRALEYYIYDMKARIPFKQQGTINLVGAIVNSYDEQLYHKPHLFGINPTGTSRTYLLQAESDDDRDEWARLIKGMIQQKLNESKFSEASVPSVDEYSRAVVIKEGMLTKQGGINRNWLQRRFQFRGGVLEYFKPETGDLAGSIQIDGAKIAILASENFVMQSSQFLFGITPLHSRRQYVFAAATADDRTSWLRCFEQYLSSNEKVDPQSLKEGYVWKQSGGILSQWQERYFVLNPSHMKYFKHKNDVKPAGIIDLSMGASLNVESFQFIKREFAFSVVPTSSKNARKYILAGTSEQHRKEWMQAILNVLQALQQRGFK